MKIKVIGLRANDIVGTLLSCTVVPERIVRSWDTDGEPEYGKVTKATVQITLEVDWSDKSEIPALATQMELDLDTNN